MSSLWCFEFKVSECKGDFSRKSKGYKASAENGSSTDSDCLSALKAASMSIGGDLNTDVLTLHALLHLPQPPHHDHAGGRIPAQNVSPHSVERTIVNSQSPFSKIFFPHWFDWWFVGREGSGKVGEGVRVGRWDWNHKSAPQCTALLVWALPSAYINVLPSSTIFF